MQFTRFRFALVALALAAGGVVGACADEDGGDASQVGASHSAGGETSARAPAASGLWFEPPPPATDFSLTGEDGQPVALSDFQGEVVAIYFGYTRCPDMCPLTLGTYKAVMERLPAGLAEQVTVVLLTVDPERDTPETLVRYTDLFGERFVGITGSLEEVDAVLHAWDIHVSRGTPDDIGAYTVAHPTDSWIVDQQGRLRLKVSHLTGVDALTADLTSILEEGTQ